MSLTRLFFGNVIKKSIGGLTMDCFVREVHSRTSRATQLPVESGVDISDHIINDPVQLEITGFKSSIGLSLFGLRLPNAHITAFEQINRLIENKTLVKVVTGFKVYTNMHIQSFNVPREANNGNTLEFTMQLQQVRKVNTLLSLIPNLQLGGDDITNLQAQSNIDIGKVTSEEGLDTGLSTSFIQGDNDGMLLIENIIKEEK